MSKSEETSRHLRLHAVAAAVLLATAAVQAQDNVDPWNVDIYYENDTRFRGEDNTDRTVGLSKFRNTLQVEADKRLGGGWAFRGILRGSFDGVYRLNDDQYGRKAGGAILLPSTGGPPDVPHGGGFINNTSVADLGLVDNTFGINSTDPGAPNYNPNAGLRVLGDRWHDVKGGVAFGVPVRPCDTDGRGCIDLGGYGDLDRSELETPEFNDRWCSRRPSATGVLGAARPAAFMRVRS